MGNLRSRLQTILAHSNMSFFLSVVALAFLIAMWAYVLARVDADYEAEFRSITRNNDNMVKAFEENVRRNFQDMDDVLLYLKKEYEQNQRVTAAMILRMNAMTSMPVNHISILDEQGTYIASVLPQLVSQNYVDREYFLTHQAVDDGKLYIAKTTIGRSTGKPTFHVSRRLNKPDGSFGGVAVVSVDVSYFADFYRKMQLGENYGINLIGRDGFIRVRQVGDKMDAGSDVREAPIFRYAAQTDIGSFVDVSFLDKTRRIYSYRIMPDYPLLVLVSVLESEALADFYQRRAAYYLNASIASIVLVAVFGLLILMVEALRRSKDELEIRVVHRTQELQATNEELIASDEELRQQYEKVLAREEEIDRQNVVLTSLHETALGLMQRLELSDLLRTIAVAATELVGTEHGYISLVIEEKGVFERKIGLGCYAPDVGRQIKVTEGIVGQVYKTAKLMVIEDYSTWEQRLPDPFFDSLHSVVQVPLKAGDRVIGTFGLAFLTPDRRFSDSDVAMLNRFAELASIALDNATLITSYRSEIQERKQAEKLQKALYLISETVSSSDNLQELYRSVHTIIGELIPARNFAIALYDEQTATLHFPYRIDERDGNPGSRKLTKGLPEYIIRTAQPLFANPEVRAELEAGGEVVMTGTAPADWLGVPLKTGNNKVFGVMSVQTFAEGARYTEKDKEILVFVSNQVAMAIKRKQAEETSKYLGIHDILTGLYNRAFFEEEIERFKQDRYLPATVVMCDIDGLKLVNDTFGHAAGDALLVATAKVIRQIVRKGDVAARIGGDEFAIFLPRADETVAQSLAGRLRTQIETYNQQGAGVPLSVSFGYAVGHTPENSVEKLLKEADDNMYREKLHHSRSARSAIVQTVMQLLEERDFVTEEHAERLQDLTSDLASRLGFDEPGIAEIRLLAKFHDIGKIGIPDHILLKAGPLTPEEWSDMKRHCEIGYRIAQASPDLLPIADWILKHQERWDGDGYPFGLIGDEIPLECRILAVADAYDAMTSDRPYRKAMSQAAAIAELRRCAGTQFDAALIEPFISILAAKSGRRAEDGQNSEGS
ncbi:MAG: diguanylate cyclase [Negativicutes bacterium]|nr:diguanylate cyclase [Negativicutes bacterium]